MRVELDSTVGRPASELSLACVKLAAAGAGVALFVATQVLGPTYRGLVLKNLLETAERNKILVAMLSAATFAALPAAVALLLVLAGRERSTAALGRIATLFAPLSLLAFAPTLFDTATWHDRPLTYLFLLGITGLVAERLFAAALGAFPTSLAEAAVDATARLSPRARRVIPLSVVMVAALGFSAWAVHYTILSHHRLATAAFDLGIYDNLMYNALRGVPFRSPVLFGPMGGHYIAGHAEFAMLLFLPFYAIRPGSEALLVIQGVVLGLAAVPLYLFAATQIPRWQAVAVAVGYLLFAPLHGPLFYDFHWLPLAIFFHFWLYWAIATNRTLLVVLNLVVLFLVREDVGVGTALLGVFLLVSGARPRLGAIMAVSSAAWFAIDKFVIMRMAGTWWFSDMYKELIAPGEKGYGSVIRTILINPVYFLTTLLVEAKLVYVLHLMAPLVFLPLRRPALALLAFPGFFFTLMTTGYSPTVSISFQYTTHWIPYLFAACVLSLRLLGRAVAGSAPSVGAVFGSTRQVAAVIVLAFTVTAHSYVFGALLQHSNFVGGFQRIEFTMTDAERQTYADLKSVIGLVPRKASVAATDSVLPHLSARETCYTLRDHHGDADFLVIHRGHLVHGGQQRTVNDAFARNNYGLFARKGNFVVFKKDHHSDDTAAVMTELGIRK